MKTLSEKTFPIGLGILTALFLANFVEEKWVGLFGIFLILGVYAIDLGKVVINPPNLRKAPRIFERTNIQIESNQNNDYFQAIAQKMGMAVMIMGSLGYFDVVYVENPPKHMMGRIVHCSKHRTGLGDEALLNIFAEEARKLENK